MNKNKLKILVSNIKNIWQKLFKSKEDVLLYLCNGESLPDILSDDEEKKYIDMLDTENSEFADTEFPNVFSKFDVSPSLLLSAKYASSATTSVT